jgi:hypothetical protein
VSAALAHHESSSCQFWIKSWTRLFNSTWWTPPRDVGIYCTSSIILFRYIRL